MLRSSSSGFSKNAYCVAVVHHNKGMVLICQIADSLEITDDPIHGKDTICGNEFYPCPCCICLFQLFFQVCHVIVFITESFCLT
ncbi:hypothetical protein EVA_17080 [gut metagenome]|uniref:Uncharacterized protein n=1 Tax=gut metagenome TaxID=749906 RepID=J9FK57_9ZZZZ